MWFFFKLRPVSSVIRREKPCHPFPLPHYPLSHPLPGFQTPFNVPHFAQVRHKMTRKKQIQKNSRTGCRIDECNYEGPQKKFFKHVDLHKKKLINKYGCATIECLKNPANDTWYYLRWFSEIAGENKGEDIEFVVKEEEDDAEGGGGDDLEEDGGDDLEEDEDFQQLCGERRQGVPKEEKEYNHYVSEAIKRKIANNRLAWLKYKKAKAKKNRAQ